MTRRPSRRRPSVLLAAGALVLALGLGSAGCGVGFRGGPAGQAAVAGAPGGDTLRLGYFANVTHATALVGVGGGFFQRALGATRLSTQIFDSGPTEISALLTGTIDAAYVGPSPAINGFVKSQGKGLRIIAGATSGGAELVVRRSITTIAQLQGATLATPQLGNTQDVALRYFLATHGLRAAASGPGAVTVEPTPNATTLILFADGRLDGGWLPEPYASELIAEGGHVLVDERSVWPAGAFATTELVVSTGYLAAHPQAVARLLQGQLDTNDWIQSHADAARTLVRGQLGKLTGNQVGLSILARSWAQITVTDDPLAPSVAQQEQHAVAVGLLEPADLSGIFDLAPLDAALKAAGRATVGGT